MKKFKDLKVGDIIYCFYDPGTRIIDDLKIVNIENNVITVRTGVEYSFDISNNLDRSIFKITYSEEFSIIYATFDISPSLEILIKGTDKLKLEIIEKYL